MDCGIVGLWTVDCGPWTGDRRTVWRWLVGDRCTYHSILDKGHPLRCQASVPSTLRVLDNLLSTAQRTRQVDLEDECRYRILTSKQQRDGRT